MEAIRVSDDEIEIPDVGAALVPPEAHGSRPAPRPEHRDGVRAEYSCASCGYGIAVYVPPEWCPMCRGRVWLRR